MRLTSSARKETVMRRAMTLTIIEKTTSVSTLELHLTKSMSRDHGAGVFVGVTVGGFVVQDVFTLESSQFQASRRIVISHELRLYADEFFISGPRTSDLNSASKRVQTRKRSTLNRLGKRLKHAQVPEERAVALTNEQE
ncbi:uncharacterized [Tachysurus ichikawai]